MKNILTILVYFLFSIISNAQIITLVKDIDPGFTLSQPRLLFGYDDKLLLKFSNGINAILYVSDGTEANTKSVLNSPSGLISYGLESILNAEDGNLYFFQNHYGDNKCYLYKLNKSSSEIEKIITVNGARGINDILFYDGSLFYLQGSDLMKYNGNGTSELIKDFGSSGSSTLVLFKNKMLIIASTANPPSMHVLYESDGSKLIKELFTPNSNSYSANSFIINDLLYIVVEEKQIVRTDGTADGTFKLLDINENTRLNVYMVELNGTTWFTASTDPNDQYFRKLYTTDGTTAGTSPIDFVPAITTIQRLEKLDDKLYIRTSENLYSSDGSSGGTQPISSEYSMFGAYKDSLVCVNSSGHMHLYKDGVFNEKKARGNRFELINMLATANHLYLIGEEQNGGIGEELYIMKGAVTNATSKITQPIFMYPNPTTGIINFSNEVNGRPAYIYDIMGRKVADVKIENGEVNISTLANGTYFVRISNADKDYNGKVILNK